MEVFVTSPWIPPEWIAAHGLVPRGAWFGQTRQPSAVPEGVCAFAQRMADLANSRPDAALVFTTACDQMRRSADAVSARANPRGFLFNLPATWQSPTARRLYHAELARLGRFLETLGGHAPTDADLGKAITDYDIRRAKVRESVLHRPPRIATEVLAQFFEAASSFQLCSESPQGFGVRQSSGAPGETASQPTAPEDWRTPKRRCAQQNDSDSSRISIALVGGPLLPSQWTLFDAIESAGGSVVLNATEPSERTLLPPLPSTLRRAAVSAAATPQQERSDKSPDSLAIAAATAGTAVRQSALLAALADHYFDHAVDVFHRPNSRLYDWLRPRLRDRRVRGIVLWVHIGCDLWRAEAATLREVFGLPVLVLDAHEVGAGGLRDTNRLAAFIESLQ